MPLDEIYIRYLNGQSLGRLSTVGPDGGPQNKPVGYRYNAALGTIDIGGFNMGGSAKYRNVGINPQVAFVVDDAIGEGPAGMRFLEVRGRAEQARVDAPDEEGPGSYLIRVHPRRVVSWNVDPEHPGMQTRDLVTDADPA
jgi:pyridoxamine 5'-phosphate oxidase family protein